MITDPVPQRANGTSWRPGQSGNPSGRPIGSRSAFSSAFLSDLMAVWQEHGRETMVHCAKHDPSLFFGICSRVLPKDVAVSITERTPGGLAPDDWQLVLAMLDATKTALPDASSRSPAQVLEFVLSAIRQADGGKLIEG